MTRFLVNPACDRTRAYGSSERAILSLAAAETARKSITSWPGYAPTPLLSLDRVARDIGVAAIHYKDEALRFGLKSFKALGGAYAVERIAAARGKAGLTVTSATDGNHGRSVAWGAQRLGIPCVIYIHETVSQGRADAIAAYGAEVRRVPGNYDDAVRAAAKTAEDNGWVVVSDTSWPGYETIPKDVMQGYAVMAMECQDQGARPTHVFIQGGVGGLAASILSYFWETHSSARPIFAVVEPETAACLYESAAAQRLTVAGGALDTIMAGLACGEPSILAWQLLQPGTDAFMTIADDLAAAEMRRLASLGIVAGESGVAGLAGLVEASKDDAIRHALKLDESSRVLVFGTEGATDEEVYAKIVGRAPPGISAGQLPAAADH